MRAHAVRTAVCRAVVAVAELVRVDVFKLGENRRWRRDVGDFIDEGNEVVASVHSCSEVEVEKKNFDVKKIEISHPKICCTFAVGTAPRRGRSRSGTAGRF